MGRPDDAGSGPPLACHGLGSTSSPASMELSERDDPSAAGPRSKAGYGERAREYLVCSGFEGTRPSRRLSEPACRALREDAVLSKPSTLSTPGRDEAQAESKRPTATLLSGRSSLSDTAVTARASAALRLPSFEALGIAAPHPDRMPGRRARDACDDGPSPRGPCAEQQGGRATAGDRPCFGPGHHMQARLGYQSMLTPPDENGALDWTTLVSADAGTPTSLHCHPHHQAHHPHHQALHQQDASSLLGSASPSHTRSRGDLGSSRASTETCGPSQAGRGGVEMSLPPKEDEAEVGGDLQNGPWLEDVLEILVSHSVLSPATENEVKVVCQTLPHPPRDRGPAKVGEAARTAASSAGPAPDRPLYTPPTAVVLVTTAIQETCLRHGRRPFIQVHHAVEKSMVNLDHLPSSPPLTAGAGFSFSTPSSPSYFTPGATGTLGGGDSPGYFARTVFNTAVPVLPALPAAGAPTAPPDLASYDEWAREQASAPLPSPNPIVLPLSHQISVLERYIPPPSPHEDQKIFSNVSSTLVDRLFELSPSGGSLLFIYPTRAGAEAFSKGYLGPILEPLLRRLMSIHGMPESFCESLDKMRAIEFMLDYDHLRGKVENICRRAKADLCGRGGASRAAGSKRSSGASGGAEGGGGGGGGIRLVYSRKTQVHLDPEDWKEWWVSQEASRIKKTISVYYEMGYNMPNGMAPGDLERAIIDGVRPLWTPQLREGQGFKPRPKATPTRTPPIEVGMFVIQRSG
ncbi:MAG: hypothetical protein M1832_005438 [Thelocarpon impressellum]|nr:MAG: hypothetical protein M1832_005438 [Thelocarpon impressellum]